MRATFYARVSSDSIEQKNSIISQVEFFKEYLKRNNFHAVNCGVFCKKDGTVELTDGYYVDEGFSGAKSYKYRKAFQQMMKDAKAKKFDMIFVKDIKRFGRNVQETLKFIGELKELGIGVYFEDIKANTLNKADDVRIGIFAVLAEDESTSKSTSVQFGKMQGYKKGIWGGREPYGYNIVDGKLTINELEAEIVREVFNLYLNECMGLRNIAITLNSRKIPTKSGKTIWNQSLISKMLKNTVYTGEIRLHRTQKVDINRNIVKQIPRTEQVILKDESIRIIDDEMFRLIQIEKEKRFKKFGDFKYKSTLTTSEDGEEEIKKIRTIERGESRHSNKHLFSNLLKCGNCGGSLRRKVQKNKNNTYIYWFCRNNDNFGKAKCMYRNLQHEEKLIDYVKQEIIEYKENSSKEMYFQDMLKTRFDIKDIDERVTKYRDELSFLKADRETNFNLFSRKKIGEEEFEERHKILNEELYDVESKLNQLLYIDEEIEKTKLRYAEFIKFLKNIDVENLTNATLRKIIHHIEATTHDESEHISFEDGNIFYPHSLKIEWNFMDMTISEILSESIKKALNEYPEEMSQEDYLNDMKFKEVYGFLP